MIKSPRVKGLLLQSRKDFLRDFCNGALTLPVGFLPKNSGMLKVYVSVNVCGCVQHVARISFSAPTAVAASQEAGSAMAIMIAAICLMNRTVEVLPRVSIFVF